MSDSSQEHADPGRPVTVRQGLHPWNRFVAIGDSFTEGVGDPEPRNPGGLRGWADRVAEELSEGHPEFTYANLAVRGLLLRQILDRQLGAAMALRPDLVTLSAGGNDLVFRGSDPDRLANDLDPAVGELVATGATIVLFTGPDWGSTPVLRHNRRKVAVFNENLRTIASRYDGVVADLWALQQLASPTMWDPDRLHFSPLGHHTVAMMVLKSLNVENSLSPSEPKTLPASSWKEARTDDIVWAREYLAPWVLRRITHRAPVQPLVAKRPEAGPVFTAGVWDGGAARKRLLP
ncbi:SGNH/GDSL hydrolase family protein [Arthrobacter sp. FW306-04-A]|uniref:SGNH/GDSL hydrolase family protein n=1 Tax=Arthrobacter sp. FW306-04-A TaxID=2879619 RepID=UPI0037BEEA3F|nr:SGNH/GDSL hydrolase family protein [Arthrobacter sp. FW306-04-A]